MRNLATEKQDQEEVICQICGGSGRAEKGRKCPNCDGAGLGLLYRGRFYFWQAELNSIFIYLVRLKRVLNWILNLVLLIAGIFGLWAGVDWWRTHGQGLDQFWLFYQQKHELLLYFWLSIVSDMFLVFRLHEDQATRQRISYFDKPGELDPVMPEVRNFSLGKVRRKSRINVLSGYRLRTLKLVERGYLLAKKMNHQTMEPVHLLLAMIEGQHFQTLLVRLNVDFKSLIEKLHHQLVKCQKGTGEPIISNAVKEILVTAYLDAARLRQPRVKGLNILLPAIRIDRVLREIFIDFELDEVKIGNAVAWFRINDQLYENYRKYRDLARFKSDTNMDKAYTAIATPLLNGYGRDLTLAAKHFSLDFCVAREAEIEAVFDGFESGRHGVLLVGEVGVGKRTIIHGIAQLMVEEQVPAMLQDKRLVELDISRLVGGANPAQAQERLLAILDEVAQSGNIVIAVKDIETITGISSGGEESLDLADVLINALKQLGIFCIATVSQENYLKYIERQPLDTAMTKVIVKEPEFNQAIIILESKVAHLESVYRVFFTYDALEEVVKLTTKYVHDKYLPAKAIEVLELLAVSMAKQHNGQKMITKSDVAEAISRQTGVPVTKVTADEGKELLNLEEKIHEHMIDQVEAVNMVAASLRRARTQLSEGKRPIASFLFLGPTGVGKTELAKTLAKVYFGDEHYMVRLDMSEYQNQAEVTKMIGSSDGTKGYLTEAVRQRPFSLLLLDEFEKAHPEILNLFLQVMDDGRLTDGTGKTIDFTNCIIIATSNAGAFYIQDEIKKGTSTEMIKTGLMNEHLNKVMRPELINRFDGLVVFKPLGEAEVLQITKLLLAKIGANLQEKGINLRYDEQGVAILAHLGFDPKFGARPLRRLLQDKIENEIANKILAGELKRRDTIIIDAEANLHVEKGTVL